MSQIAPKWETTQSAELKKKKTNTFNGLKMGASFPLDTFP